MGRSSLSAIVGIGLFAGVRLASAGTPVVGIMTDVGVPDGATASLAVKPARWLRLEAGAGHDGAGPGVRAGASWVMRSGFWTPVVSVGAGRFFERDANPVVRLVMGDQAFSSPLLDRVGYDFAVARTGLELGSQHVTFFIHGGVTAITGSVHELAKLTNDQGSQVTITTTDPRIRVYGISADVGFIFYLH